MKNIGSTGHRLLSKYSNQLARNIQLGDAYKTINLVFSSGGIAGMYQAGVSAYLCSLYNQKKIGFHKIYGASAGACAGAFFIYMLSCDSEEYTIDEFMDMINTKLRAEYIKEKKYITNAWRNVMNDVFPDDIHLSCNDKLYISIHVIETFKLIRNDISKYYSKQHLIDVIHTSMSIPCLTIPTFFKSYFCPFTNKTFMAFDGVFVPDMQDENDKNYQTLVVDLHSHSYPYRKRLHLLESSYDHLVTEGINNTNELFHTQHEIPALYFDSNEIKQPKVLNMLFVVCFAIMIILKRALFIQWLLHRV